MLQGVRKAVSTFSGPKSDGSFLPEAYVRTRTERRANLLGLSLFGVVMLCVVGAFFVTNHRWISVREQRDVIDELYQQQAARIEELKKLEEQRREMIDKAAVTTSIVEMVPRSVLLAVLSRPMPERMTLLELEVSSEKIALVKDSAAKAEQAARGVRSIQVATSVPGAAPAPGAEEEKAPIEPERFRHSIRLEGVAPTNEEIAEYIDRLEEGGMFESLELAFIKESKIDGVGLRKFEIAAQVDELYDARDYFARLGEAGADGSAVEGAVGGGVAGQPGGGGGGGGGLRGMFSSWLGKDSASGAGGDR